MKSFLLTLALCLAPLTAWGQVTAKIDGPAEVKPFALAILDGSKSAVAESFAWSLVGGDSADFYSDTSGKVIVFTGPEGSYTFLLAVAGTHEGKAHVAVALHTVVIGKPIPPKPPEPPVPPSGERAVLILRETADATDRTRAMIVGLRAGSQAAYLKSKNHKLTILDDDTVDKDGKSVLDKWLPHVAGLALPVCIVYDPINKAILAKQSLPATATADTVIELVKKNGG